jgi:hypothetical protein
MTLKGPSRASGRVEDDQSRGARQPDDDRLRHIGVFLVVLTRGHGIRSFGFGEGGSSAF